MVIWGYQPENAVSARERLGDDADVVVRPLHHLDAPAHARGKTGGIARIGSPVSRTWWPIWLARVVMTIMKPPNEDCLR